MKFPSCPRRGGCGAAGVVGVESRFTESGAGSGETNHDSRVTAFELATNHRSPNLSTWEHLIRYEHLRHSLGFEVSALR